MLKLETLSSMNKRTKRIIELQQFRGLGRLAMVCKSSREFDMTEIIGTYELQVVAHGFNERNLHPGHEGKSLLLQSLEGLCEEKEETDSVAPVTSKG